MQVLDDRVRESQHKQQHCDRQVTTAPHEWELCIRTRAVIGNDRLRAYPCGLSASGSGAGL